MRAVCLHDWPYRFHKHELGGIECLDEVCHSYKGENKVGSRVGGSPLRRLLKLRGVLRACGHERPLRGTAFAASLNNCFHLAFDTMSRCTVDTVWPADSVEFCPHPAAHNIFVCGTYNLEKNEGPTAEETDAIKKPQVRRGKCALFEVDNSDQLYGDFSLTVTVSNDLLGQL